MGARADARSWAAARAISACATANVFPASAGGRLGTLSCGRLGRQGLLAPPNNIRPKIVKGIRLNIPPVENPLPLGRLSATPPGPGTGSHRRLGRQSGRSGRRSGRLGWFGRLGWEGGASGRFGVGWLGRPRRPCLKERGSNIFGLLPPCRLGLPDRTERECELTVLVMLQFS